MIEVPAAVRNKAVAVGAHEWLQALPDMIEELSLEWEIAVGEPYMDGTEAYVAQATTATGVAAVLKLLVPREGRAALNEITVLRLADGDGCAELYREDVDRGALLLERLGPSLYDLGRPAGERHRILCDTATSVWRPAHDSGLPNGSEKASWLIDHVANLWERLDRPCSERSVEYAIHCAEHRMRAHDDERALMVHGDVQQWNTLQSATGFKLVDPDGLLAEPEYDLGIIMREDPAELLSDGYPRRRARWLASRTGLDAVAIWEWGVVERVSTGLLATMIDLQPVGRQMLDAADQVADQYQD